MNVNSSDSKSLSQWEVRSKYFTERPVMDESLSDFQEKKTLSIPKKTKKASKNNKTKKTKSQIRGQKDIRTALKCKKNELVAYSNDFDKICKQSGIDVDPEQLQLAIALSKSLQQPEGALESNDSQSSGSQTSNERSGKIRTTLLEYGFKVPEIKTTATKSRKLKKHRKNYKLLLASEVEKKQLISDRYSQVLFQNIKNTTAEIFNIDETKAPLYHKATNNLYKVVKSNDSFYVKDLVEVNNVTAGGLLKDWSEIPGRPATPTLELLDIKFSDIYCSHKEFDNILAGPLETAQEIVKEKNTLIGKEDNLQSSEIKIDLKMDTVIDKLHKTISYGMKNETDELIKTSKNIADNPVIMLGRESPQTLSATSQIRSCSPDIFDEEESSIIDISKDNTYALSQENPCTNMTKQRSNFMNLAECVDVSSQKSLNTDKTMLKTNSRNSSQPSQEQNKTKRRSNDFMEITECVATSSQPETNKEIQSVDLTQSSIHCNLMSVSSNKILENIEVESMDLTQSSDSNESLPFVQISGKDKTFDDTIVLANNVYVGVSNHSKYGFTVNSKFFNANYNKPERDDFIYSEDCNEGANSLLVIDNGNDDDETNKNNEKQSKSDNQGHQNEWNISLVSKCQSFFDDFVHPHSDSSEEHSEVGELCVNETHDSFIANESINHKKINNGDIDLIQSPRTSAEKDGIDIVIPKKTLECGIHNNYDERATSVEIDLTQSSESSVKVENRDVIESKEPLHDIICVIECHNKSDIDNSLNHGNSVSNDLTQSSDSGAGKFEYKINSNNTPTRDNSTTTKASDTNSLGKIGDVSIDYDEMFDDIIASQINQSNSYKSENNDFLEINASTDKVTRRSHSISYSSNNSDVFENLDNELNYSINKSRHEIENRNCDIGGLSVIEDLSKASGSKISTGVENIINLRESINESLLPEVNLGGSKKNKYNSKTAESKTAPCRNALNNNINSAKTPVNSDFIIKTDNVTPMLDYESLTTPERNRELDKYGLKPFKRKRAIKLLTHLYNQTHPIVESCSIEILPSPSKKLKRDNHHISNTQVYISPKKKNISPTKSKVQSPRKRSEAPKIADNEELEEINKGNDDVYRVTNVAPEIRKIECSEEDWVFQKREKAKLHSCRVPLHVAFHNYVSCRQGLREAILRYEPVNIDFIHKGLIDSGHKYDAKELLKFMDKKCITVKTADNNAKPNRKHY